MNKLIDWIYTSSLSQSLQGIFGVIPVVQIIHILCIAVLFTSMIMFDARLIGVAGRHHSIDSFATVCALILYFQRVSKQGANDWKASPGKRSRRV